jgi:hypothetical protein
MKINLRSGYIAILSEDSGAAIGCIHGSIDAQSALENAVGQSFGCEASLQNPKDFNMVDITTPYSFLLDHGNGNTEHVTMFLTYAKLF